LFSLDNNCTCLWVQCDVSHMYIIYIYTIYHYIMIKLECLAYLSPHTLSFLCAENIQNPLF
jgi:hypothetical protein